MKEQNSHLGIILNKKINCEKKFPIDSEKKKIVGVFGSYIINF